MVPGHCGMILGPGGVVRDGLSGWEDGCDLFESCAALGGLLGRHTSRQEQSVEKRFWERIFLKIEKTGWPTVAVEAAGARESRG